MPDAMHSQYPKLLHAGQSHQPGLFRLVYAVGLRVFNAL